MGRVLVEREALTEARRTAVENTVRALLHGNGDDPGLALVVPTPPRLVNVDPDRIVGARLRTALTWVLHSTGGEGSDGTALLQLPGA